MKNLVCKLENKFLFSTGRFIYIGMDGPAPGEKVAEKTAKIQEADQEAGKIAAEAVKSIDVTGDDFEKNLAKLDEKTLATVDVKGQAEQARNAVNGTLKSYTVTHDWLDPGKVLPPAMLEAHKAKITSAHEKALGLVNNKEAEFGEKKAAINDAIKIDEKSSNHTEQVRQNVSTGKGKIDKIFTLDNPTPATLQQIKDAQGDVVVLRKSAQDNATLIANLTQLQTEINTGRFRTDLQTVNKVREGLNKRLSEANTLAQSFSKAVDNATDYADALYDKAIANSKGAEGGNAFQKAKTAMEAAKIEHSALPKVEVAPRVEPAGAAVEKPTT